MGELAVVEGGWGLTNHTARWIASDNGFNWAWPDAAKLRNQSAFEKQININLSCFRVRKRPASQSTLNWNQKIEVQKQRFLLMKLKIQNMKETHNWRAPILFPPWRLSIRHARDLSSSNNFTIFSNHFVLLFFHIQIGRFPWHCPTDGSIWRVTQTWQLQKSNNYQQARTNQPRLFLMATQVWWSK